MTDLERLRVLDTVERLREPYYKSAQEAVAALFENDRVVARTALLERGTEAVIPAIEAVKERWQTLIEGINYNTMPEFGQRVYESVKGDLPDEIKFFDRWLRGVRNYIQKVTASKVVRIFETTKRQIAGAIDQGILRGETMQEIAARIDQLYLENIIPNRSMTIARTEVIQASNAGAHYGAQQTGAVLHKEWISTHDERTREHHEEADGQICPQNTPFTVKGQSLMFPGDWSLGATADNIINCRCTVGYFQKRN